VIELKGRKGSGTVPAEAGLTLLEHAFKHEVDWGFSCVRGTCGRCRCLIEEGKEFLNEVTDEEWDRMEQEELDAGFRLACQAVVRTPGSVKAVYKPYF